MSRARSRRNRTKRAESHEGALPEADKLDSDTGPSAAVVAAQQRLRKCAQREALRQRAARPQDTPPLVGGDSAEGDDADAREPPESERRRRSPERGWPRRHGRPLATNDTNQPTRFDELSRMTTRRHAARRPDAALKRNNTVTLGGSCLCSATTGEDTRDTPRPFKICDRIGRVFGRCGRFRLAPIAKRRGA